jgi:hypothetical protein
MKLRWPSLNEIALLLAAALFFAAAACAAYYDLTVNGGM